MASIDGHTLDLTAAGGVMFLTTEAQRDWVEKLTGGTTVTTITGSQVVIVSRLPDADDLDGAADLAHQRINEALDLMAIRSVGLYALREPSTPSIAWTSAHGQVRLRTTSYQRSTGSLAVGGPPRPAPTGWHPSARYFRLSQLTTDLFDAFRNLYLALESILSMIEPAVTPDGRSLPDGKWLKQALSTAQQRLLDHNAGLTFARYSHTPQDPTLIPTVEEIFDDLYVRVRTTVFHAKNNRPVALPQLVADRPAVVSALKRYGQLYIDLADVILGYRFLASGFTDVLSQWVSEQFTSKWTVGVFSRTFATEDEFEQHGAADLTPMRTSRAPEFDVPFVATARGELTESEIPNDLVVRSFGARQTEDNAPLTVDNLGGALTLDGVDYWEHILTCQQRNKGLKVDYES